jgi:hypothetical protein
VSALLTWILYVIPYGHVVIIPLLWLSTLVHELGHGFTALLVGGRFDSIVVSMDGSGVAATATGSTLAGALVAAGGLVGPAVAAAGCFAVSRTPRGSVLALMVAVGTLVAVDVLWMSNLFGVLFTASLAAVLGWIGTRWTPESARVVVSFLGVQLALAVFQRSDYLFSPVAHTARGVMPSDVALIARALWLPIPVWGTLIGLVSLGVLVWGLWWSLGPWPSLRRAAR